MRLAWPAALDAAAPAAVNSAARGRLAQLVEHLLDKHIGGIAAAEMAPISMSRHDCRPPRGHGLSTA